MSIYELNVGDSGVVDYIDGENDFTKRLLALGCTEGTHITLKK